MAMNPLESEKRKRGYKGYKEPNEVLTYNYLPEPEGEEKFYMLSLSPSSPRGELSLLGLTFARQNTTPVTSVTEYPKPTAIFVKLADNQLEAIKIKAEKKFVTYRDEKNMKVEKPYNEYINIIQYPYGNYEHIELFENIASKVYSCNFDNIEDQIRYQNWLENHLREVRKKTEEMQAKIIEQKEKELETAEKIENEKDGKKRGRPRLT